MRSCGALSFLAASNPALCHGFRIDHPRTRREVVCYHQSTKHVCCHHYHHNINIAGKHFRCYTACLLSCFYIFNHPTRAYRQLQLPAFSGTRRLNHLARPLPHVAWLLRGGEERDGGVKLCLQHREQIPGFPALDVVCCSLLRPTEDTSSQLAIYNSIAKEVSHLLSVQP